MAEAVQCRHMIVEEAIPGRGVVFEQHQCKNKTTDPSGLCHLHRGVQRAASEEVIFG